ncbi:hypothetical protein LCGC14_1274790 [marine sediment metagenome]|uniref:Uncharacterized protein n=1 Tax=marine sediment metagenome TaxID=412755 RepID=A0A0F9KYQ3_9ZZZZ
MKPYPKTPTASTWRRFPAPVDLARQKVLAYRRGSVVVFSQVAPMKAPDGSDDVLPTWLVSVSQRDRSMPTDETMEIVRRAFGMLTAEEDNHLSGISRDLFMVVDPARRVDCECKEDEITIERPDGYRYTQPRDRRVW